MLQSRGNPHCTERQMYAVRAIWVPDNGQRSLCPQSRTEISCWGRGERSTERTWHSNSPSAEESRHPIFCTGKGVAPKCAHTVCHLAFDLSASNLATSFWSWNDTSSFQMHSRTTPMRRIASETPNMIMGIFGGCGQSVETKKITLRRWYN